jgi:small conductance mechanosensitive channel
MTKIIDLIDAEVLITKFMTFLPDLLAAVAILITFWVFYRISQKPMRLIFQKAGIHENLIRLLINNVYKYALMFLSLIMAGGQIGFNIGAMLAGFGVAGIAIGFAAQDSLANTISGFLIFWDKPFEVGDWVIVTDRYGQVSQITLRSTRIRTINNTYVVIPNRKVIENELVNHSKHGRTRVEVPVGIAYKENIADARNVILTRLEEVKGILGEPAPDVVVTQLGSSSVDLLVRVWIENAKDEKPIFFKVMEACKLALDEAGIQIPYHHLQLFIDNVEDRVWEKAKELRSAAANI